MNQLVPPYRLIQESIHRGRVIPFLGAGASLGRRDPSEVWNKDTDYLPTAAELASYLALKIQFPEDESLDLAKVAQYYNIIGGREPLNADLHEIFARRFALSSLHTMLANARSPLLIVTSNYDDLIERAFDDKGRPYHVVIHTTDPAMGYQIYWWPPGATEPQEAIPNKLDIDLEKDTVIYKMHGAVDHREAARDQFVITEDDYIDFLARMTKNRAIPSIFFRAFNTRHFLFLGYALRDWNFRVVLSRIGKDLHRTKDIKSWAIQYRPSFLEQRFWQDRGVEVYDMLIEEFVRELGT